MEPFASARVLTTQTWSPIGGGDLLRNEADPRVLRRRLRKGNAMQFRNNNNNYPRNRPAVRTTPSSPRVASRRRRRWGSGCSRPQGREPVDSVCQGTSKKVHQDLPNRKNSRSTAENTKSGHYFSFVKEGESWFLLDDQVGKKCHLSFPKVGFELLTLKPEESYYTKPVASFFILLFS